MQAITFACALNDVGSWSLVAWQATFYERVYDLGSETYAPLLAVIIPVRCAAQRASLSAEVLQPRHEVTSGLHEPGLCSLQAPHERRVGRAGGRDRWRRRRRPLRGLAVAHRRTSVAHSG